MPVKKAPTRKQLAARKKFVKMVRARSRALKAAKRAAGKRPVRRATVKRAITRRRNVEQGFMSSGVFHPIRASSDYLPSAAGESPGRRSRRKLAGVKRSKKYTTAAGKAKVAAYKKRTGKAQRNPITCVKNGRRLYGAAAQAVLKSRGGKKRAAVKCNSVKRRGVMLSGRKRNGIFRSAARAAISRRLSAPVRFKRRRNSGAPEPIEAMTQKFLGRPTSPEREMELVAPEGTPRDVARLGDLVLLKTDIEEFAFDEGEAYLLADGRGQLYVGFGSEADVEDIDPNTNFGHIEQVNYVAQKDHLNPRNRRHSRRKRRNGEPIEWFHHFGEEGGQLPKLQSDKDGMLHIVGGSYTIEAEGITD